MAAKKTELAVRPAPARLAAAAWVAAWFLFGLATLTARELHGDDINLLEGIVNCEWSGLWTAVVGHPPLYPALLKLWAALGGLGDAWVRLPALLAGAAALAAAYRFGERWATPAVGLVGALVLGASLQFLLESQRVHVYSLMTLLTILSWHFFLRALTEPGRRGLIGLIAVNLLGFHTHFFFVANLLAQAGAALAVTTRRRPGGPWLERRALAGRLGLVVAVLGLACLPELVVLFKVRLPRARQVMAPHRTPLAAGEEGESPELTSTLAAHYGHLAYCLFFSEGVWEEFTGEDGSRERAMTIVGSGLLAVMIPALLLARRRPVFFLGLTAWSLALLFPLGFHLLTPYHNVARRGLFVLPALALALGVIAAAAGAGLAGRLWRRGGSGAAGPLALLGAVLLAGPWLYLTVNSGYRDVRQRDKDGYNAAVWRDLAAVLAARADPERDWFFSVGQKSNLVLFHLAAGDPGRFRALLDRHRWVLGIRRLDSLPGEFRQPAGDPGRVWTILAHSPHHPQDEAYITPRFAAAAAALGGGAPKLYYFDHWHQLYAVTFGPEPAGADGEGGD